MKSTGWGITALAEDDFVCDKCRREFSAYFAAEANCCEFQGVHVEKLDETGKKTVREKYICLECLGKIIMKQYHFDGGSGSYCERCGEVARCVGGERFCASCDEEDSENEW